MPGAVNLTFRREPSFQDASVVEGPFRQTLVCRHQPTGQIVGFGCRSISDRWVNGDPRPIGYLSQLRLIAEHRRRGLVARGYGHFRQLHADNRTQAYLTTIADDNRTALGLLTSRRAGLPTYHDFGHYHSSIVNPRKLSQLRPSPSLPLRRATLSDRPALLDLLKAEGPRRQFFPCVEESDLFADGGLFRDLAPEHFWLAWEGSELVGCLGVWNQRGFRQQVIEGYQGILRIIRPVHNLAAPALGWPRLPPAGSLLAANFAALPVTRSQDPEIVLALLQRAVTDCGSRGEHLVVGLHERDPWWPVIQTLTAFRYTTRLFLVCYPEGEPLLGQLDDRPPYLEIGCL